MTRWTPVFLSALALLACKPAAQTDTANGAVAPTPVPEWAKTAAIYEVNVRQFTPQGTFTALRAHLPRLDSLGVDILWIMPVQPIGKLNRKGSLGSYYSISDYTAINPEYGTTADFKAFVDDAHQRGMKVILDWVANHTSHDHPWTQNKSWYVLNPDGSISNARDNENRPTDWTDVAELNYENRDMRRAMLDEMRWWVDSMGVDGFRADVQLGVPNDFWIEARRELDKVRPDLFWLAEADSPLSHEAFHMTYGWELHHLLNEVSQGKKPTAELDKYFTEDAREFKPNALRMYFTSNHDENSWQGTEFERMGENHLPSFVLAATARSSMPLVYTGQEVSNKKRYRFFEKDTVDWSGPSLAPFYRRMLALKDSVPAVWNAPWGGTQSTLETDGGDRIYAFTRDKDASSVVVAVNFGDVAKRVKYQGLTQPGSYRDWFTNAPIALAASGEIEIPAHGYRVLVR
ncbi:MAG TPA: alpha-amylase family glycosyl hydrolase [Gemmatimonadaceae bacterium]|nr:alpha-amylase family glycosyl hydrolase [Gemmatimonadaceae bacterium]